MTALEPIIAALLGSGVTSLAVWIAKLLATQKYLKYGSILSRAYDIIDPLLETNLKNWGGSDVEFAIELAIEAVADGKVTPDEIKIIAKEASERWLPAVAAEKVRKYVTATTTPKELEAAEALANHVNGLMSKDVAVEKVRELITE